jgi:hypothetical protein
LALFIKKRPLGWCQKGSPSVDGNGQTSLSVSNCVKLCQESHIDSFLTQFLRILESVDWLHRNRHISYTFFWIFRVSWLITQKATLFPEFLHMIWHFTYTFSPDSWCQLTDYTKIDSFLTHFSRFLESVDWWHRNRHISYTFLKILVPTSQIQRVSKCVMCRQNCLH